ncbi:MAG: fibro-slime domain-containing protein [Clostridia bacterium]|nr:fibro-slime domain-containing protein [Clostridia bacterium]
MKRIISLFMTIVMVVTLVAVNGVTSNAEDSRKVKVTIRDFKMDHKLFEGAVSSQEGLVRTTLGADKKPDFSDPANPGKPLPAWSAWDVEESPVTLDELKNFFNDVPGVNQKTTKYLIMTKDSDGFYNINRNDANTFKDGMFFPIDNEFYGNEGLDHNFHFSMELHAKFTYKGFEEFSFQGDDDVWVFINNQLVIDLGGVHGSQDASILLPELVKQGKLNLVPGQSFDFDMFYMERCTTESNLDFSTNIDLSNMPYGQATLTKDLDKAADYGFIPDTIKDNMITPITRQEFAEVAVNFYEKVTSKEAAAASATTFTDCSNQKVLKAFQLGITNGKADGGKKFLPQNYITRQEMAAMITRTLKACYPDIVFDISGQPDFKDQKQILSYANVPTKFMAKYSITNGDGKGNFMPLNTCTREQAVAFLVRAFDNKSMFLEE